MSHSFVAAKLSPNLPEWSIYGPRVAQSLVTTPFLAVHVEEPNSDPLIVGPRAPNLFIISSIKPDMSNNEYFTLNDPNDERTLTVVPHLPFQHPLYLFVTPRIWCNFEDSATFDRLLKAEPYHLSPSSFERFQMAVQEAGPSFPGIRETGTGEQPLPEWDTWSAYSRREGPGVLMLRKYVPLEFDLAPLTALPNNLATDVLKQIALYRQLYLDYTWKGCRNTLECMESMKVVNRTKHNFVTLVDADLEVENIPLLELHKRVVRLPSLNLSQDRALDPLVNLARPAAIYLKAQPILNDGDPDETDDIDDIDDDSDDDADPLLNEAEVVPAAKPGKIKLIALDCNAIINNDRVLSSVLANLFPRSVHQFANEELLYLYVEKEALLKADGSELDSPFPIIQEVARYLNTTVSQSDVQDAFARSEHLKFYGDTFSSIASLVEAGIAVIALPLDDFECRDMVSQIPGLSLAFYDVVRDRQTQTGDGFAWNELLEFCKQSNFPEISPNGILVITPNVCFVAEPATLAGFPTAFIKRRGSRCQGLNIPSFSPTYQVTRMDQVLPILLNPDSAPPPKEPEDPKNVYPPYPLVRVRDCYQITCKLGEGSNCHVWGGIQLVTGDYVAIKFDEIMEGKPSLLSYEAAVYAQLEGIKGVVRIRWTGVEHNVHVIVMDRLGPDLECLRRFCRGKLSLKTVLMLGEQMLTTIEEVHAHGIIVRDFKPQNFALGLMGQYKCLYLIDMGFAKLFLDPATGEHMPFRDGRAGLGTPIFSSHNVHFGLEPSRRDDVESIGFSLLYLIHGRLPWQGIYAPDVPSKLKEFGNMKRGKPMSDLLNRSAPCFARFFEHCRSLGFEDKPDYAYLRDVLREEMKEHGWEYDWEYDWWVCGERGTLFPDEYKLDERFIEPVRHRQRTL